jgi:hypothetical protein
MTKASTNSLYWHEEYLPLAEGCPECPDFSLCGGIRVAANVKNCLELSACSGCGRPTNSVSKLDPRAFVQRKREVRGWELDLPQLEYVPSPTLARFIPIIYSRSKRSLPLQRDTIAIPISEILNKRTGMLNVSTREELCERFLIHSHSKILLSGVHHDPTLESYWSHGRARDIAEQMRQLRVEIVTTPNYSVFSNVERWDNFHNMKRIAICWHELYAKGIATTLHVNARTPQDYQRWADFLNQHSEIDTISFEFQTGISSVIRSTTHLSWLKRFSDRVRRPLNAIVFGGVQNVAGLASIFTRVSHVSATPFMKTAHYKKLVLVSGNSRALRDATTDMPRDLLLPHNITACETALLSRVYGAA